MSKIIDELRVILGLDSKPFNKGLKDSQSSMAAFGSALGKTALAAGAAIAGAATALGVSISHQLENADKMGKMAQSAGLPVEEFSKLAYAAKLSDVSVEDLGKNVGKLSKNMVEVAGGAVGPAASAFNALGISVKNSDGTLKSSSQVIQEVAGKMAGFEDSAAKTALAMAIFGKSGAAMIPLLNSGADGLKEMMEEAEQLGIVIDSKTAKSAEAFNDNLTRLGKVKDGIVLQITARMLPTLENLSNQFVAVAKNSSLLDKTATVLSVTLKGLVSIGVTMATIYQAVGERLGGVANAVMLAAKGQFAAAWQAIEDGAKASDATLGGLADSLIKVWDDSATAVEAKAPEIAKKIAAPIMQASADSKDALTKFLDSTAKQTAARVAEAATVGKTAGEVDRLKISLQAEAIAKTNNIALTEAWRAKIAAAGDAAAAASLKLQGAQLAQDTMTPAEQFAQKLDLQRQMFEQGAISAETYGRAQQKTAEAAGATWDIAGASIAGSIADVGKAFGKENKEMAAVAKVAGIIQSTISMFTGAAKALELPFPANLAAMATVIATGAGLVAQIQSTSTAGFATGGSFRVPGAGSPDSQQMMLDLTPGEQVDIWRPGDAGGDPRRGAGAAQPVNVTLKGRWIDRESLRELIEGLNGMGRFGYRLNLAGG